MCDEGAGHSIMTTLELVWEPCINKFGIAPPLVVYHNPCLSYLGSYIVIQEHAKRLLGPVAT